MASTIETGISTAEKTAAESAAKSRKDAAHTHDDINEKAAEIAASAQEALDRMRRIIDDFAAKTEGSASGIIERVKEKRGEAAECVTETLKEASTLGRDAVGGLSNAVAKKPMTAVLAALGVGLIIGFASRGSSRK